MMVTKYSARLILSQGAGALFFIENEKLFPLVSQDNPNSISIVPLNNIQKFKILYTP
jgi:hypothetical protein